MNKNKLIPKLRFHEFDDEWKSCKLHELCKVQDGTHSTPHYVEEGIPFFSVDTIINNANPKYISKEDHEKLIKRCNPKKGDILLSRITGGILGYPKLVDWDFEFSIYVSLALLSSIKINPKYLNYYIQSSVYRKDFLSKSLLTASPPKINLKDLESTNIKYPNYHEQEMIANFFFSLNKKITLLENKYHSYKYFKKYLMQQIFAGKLRFDFEDEWKEIKLKDIGTFYRGHSYNSNNVVDDGLLVLRSNNIQENSLDFSDSGLQFVNKDCKKELELQKNDIVICMSNGTRSLVGKSAQYLGNYDKKLTVGAFCSIFRTNNILAKYLFQTEIYKKNLYLILAGTNINNLKNTDLEKFKFEIPTNELEIKKIHDLFSSVDVKIESNRVQLNEITQFKKGLLQQMFVYILMLTSYILI